MAGHQSRQDDGSWTECAGPTSYIIVVNPSGGGVMDYTCAGCGKRWAVS